MSILINKNTRVITQGMTGKVGQFHTVNCKAYANGAACFVAGVNPKKPVRRLRIFRFTRLCWRPSRRQVPRCR